MKGSLQYVSKHLLQIQMGGKFSEKPKFLAPTVQGSANSVCLAWFGSACPFRAREVGVTLVKVCSECLHLSYDETASSF